MAETRTSRLSLPQWSAGTDSPTRSDFNEAFLNLETFGARDEQNTFALRPAFGIRGRYFYDTTNLILWRDTGTAWTIVGAVTQDSVTKSSVAGNSALIAQAAAAQTADIVQVRNDAGVVYSSFDNTGALRTAYAHMATSTGANQARLANASLSLIASGAANPVAVLRGVASQTADLLKLQNSSGTDLTRVGADGTVTAPNVVVTNLVPANAGNLTSKSYVDGKFVTLSNGAVVGNLDIAGGAGTNEFLSAPTVGDTLGFRVSRAATRDTTPMALLPTSQVQIGGLTGARPATTPLLVSGTVGQTADLLSVDSVPGTPVFRVSPTGALTTPQVTLGTAPTVASHAATKGYVDGNFLYRANDTLTNANFSDGYFNSPVIGQAVNLRTSRVAEKDTIGLRVNADGGVQIGGIQGGQGNVTTLILKNDGSQTAKVLVHQSSAGAELFSVDPNGVVSASNFTSGTTTQRTAALSSTPNGALWFDTTLNDFYQRVGGNWVQLVPRVFDAGQITTGTFPLNRGGTGATTAAAARTALGVPAIAHTHLWADLTDKPATFPATAHTHNDLYYLKTETYTQADSNFRFYTKADVNNLLATTTAPDSLKLNGRKYTVSPTAPSSPAVGDVWLKN